MSQVPASSHFVYRGGQLHADGVPLARVADQFGTPTFVYSGASIDQSYRDIDAALSGAPHLVAYAAKANGNLAILKRLAALGSGVDIVSGGELARALKAGVAADRIVFSGVGKTAAEIRAALQAGVRSLHAESASEIRVIERVAAELSVRAPVSLRVNPNVDAKTHPYISTGLHSTKFGLPFDAARALLPTLIGNPHLRFEGLACHIGSLVLDPTPIGDAVALVSEFAVECARAGAKLRSIDAGGGWPILYGHEDQGAAPFSAFGAAVLEGVKRGGADKLGLEVMVEPGRSIVGDAGVLLTRVLYIKEQSGKRFAIVDAAMTELIRPALYEAYHAIVPVQEPNASSKRVATNVVGPVCESADFLALDRDLPEVREGDLIAVRGAGAYGAAMSSEYNARPRAAEVMVDGDQLRAIRKRGTIEDLWRDEVM